MPLIKEDGTLDEKAAEKILGQHEKDNPPDPADENGEAGKGKEEDKPGEKPGDEKPGDEKEPEDEETIPDETDTGGDDDDDEWRTTEDAAEILESLGLTEDDIEDFSELEEWQRHADLVDKQGLIAGKAAKDKPGDEREAALKAERADREKAARERDANGRLKSEEKAYKPGLDPDIQDHDVIEEFTKLGSHTEERFQRFEAELKEFRAEQVSFRKEQAEAAFGAMVDTLKETKLLGTSKVPKQRAMDRLQDAVEVLQAGLAAKGRSAALTPALVKRALQLEFADELKKQDRRSLHETIRKQSKKKLGGGGRGSRSGRQAEWKGAPEDDPVLHAAFKEIVKEGG